MATQFFLSVVAPDKAVVEENVTAIVAPGTEGYFGVWAGHFPVIAALRPGLLEYTDASADRHYVYVGGGFAEVQSDKVTILADEAERAIDIELSKAEHALEEARKALRGEETSVNSTDAVLEVERAVSRIKAARMAMK
ncbi:MAG: ATP synthase F1 subunit epsilon [Fimbriimonas sp.]|nr:ATP synthase F1 subunit epsilon [Fimbriimonas sp.]